MSNKHRTILFWALAVAAAITFVAIVSITGFEAHVRWTLNQNYMVLGGDGLPGLMFLFASEIFALVWFSRS